MRHYFANNKVKIQAVALIFFSIISTNAEAQCNDFANLGKYKASNDIEKKGAAVFFGNSITEMWKETDPAFFADNHFINRGISGQTTSQMLLRFRQDVIGLQPRIVAILCGINDIAENTGPISVGDIENNIKCMAELGKYHHIKIILCSILPSNYIHWNETIHPENKIDSINKWLEKYASQNGFLYANYYAQLVDERRGMKKEFTTDGVHCTKEAYAAMEKIIAPMILSRSPKK